MKPLTDFLSDSEYNCCFLFTFTVYLITCRPIKLLHKTVGVTTKKCENKNLKLIFTLR